MFGLVALGERCAAIEAAATTEGPLDDSRLNELPVVFEASLEALRAWLLESSRGAAP